MREGGKGEREGEGGEGRGMERGREGTEGGWRGSGFS